MNLSKAVRTAQVLITANSPVLLVGAAVAGVVTTSILAAKAGYQARGIIDAAEAAADEPLTVPEKVKLTWLCYAAPAVTGATTIASVVGVHTIHTKRHAALAGLYAVANTKLDDYREKAEELLGPKKTQVLNDSVAQRSLDRREPSIHEVVLVEGGTDLMYDEWSGRYFMGSVAIVERAVNEINLMLAETGDANLNDFYDHLGLTPLPMGLNFGWSGARVEVRFGAVQTPDGRAAVAFWTSTAPKERLGRS